jgi:hypothetical protein
VETGHLVSVYAQRRQCLLQAIGKKKADALAAAGVNRMPPEEKAALKEALKD